jgi:hypothetical protein
MPRQRSLRIAIPEDEFLLDGCQGIKPIDLDVDNCAGRQGGLSR